MTQTVRVIDKQPIYVTPYLPEVAISTMRNWEKTRKMPVFVMAIDHRDNNSCCNCAGVGVVFVKLAGKGPFTTPLSSKEVYTWFDGNGQYGKGWYVVEETFVYPCPECKGGY